MNWIYQLYCHQIFPWMKWIEYIKFIVIKSVSTQLWTQSPPQLCQLWTHTLTQLTNFHNTFMKVRTFLITHCECKGSPTKTKVHWFMPYWVEYILLGVYEKNKNMMLDKVDGVLIGLSFKRLLTQDKGLWYYVYNLSNMLFLLKLSRTHLWTLYPTSCSRTNTGIWTSLIKLIPPLH